MKFREITEADLEMLNKIVEIEEEAFEGNGNVDLWILKALIRYGKVFILEEGGEIISIVEYMQEFQKDSLFLYGISTRKNIETMDMLGRLWSRVKPTSKS